MENDVKSPKIQFFKADLWDDESPLNDGCVYKLSSGSLCEGQEDLVMVVNGQKCDGENMLSVRSVGNGSVRCDDDASFSNGTSIYFVESEYKSKITFLPNENCKVKSVTINGEVVEPVGDSILIGGSSVDTSVVVTFEDIVFTKYSLSISTIGNGKAIYNGNEVKGETLMFDVEEGSKVVIDFVPDDENVINGIIVNGVEKELSDGKYCIDSMKQNIAIGATFNPSGFPVPKYVDMGCSVYWADLDVGATDSSEYGLYYGWGALTDADGDYAKGFGGESIAGTEYDVANAKWGDGWRMPTFADFEELFSKCRAPERVKNGDISGYRLTSKYTNNSIFLPAAGYASKDKYAEVGRYLYFWTAVKDPNGTNPVLCRFTASGPVSRPNSPRLRAMVGAVYSKSETEPETDPESEGAGKAVDLGLGVKWSDVNLGAKTDTEFGLYIPWACLGEPEDGDYSKNAHKFYHNGEYEDIGKDFNFEGTYQYDAARKMWGGKWRLPTQKEMSYLWIYCKWEWTYKDGVYGAKITGENGNSIFLPAAGWKMGEDGKLVHDRRYCGYWTSSLNLRNPDYGLNLQANEETNNPIPGTYREFGLTIRPVCD